ncbi:hypothetical protein KAFR_0E02910 [Kazachstania africana CBS 2517]|uniref:Uncharacterized protein n=1 Tax=Kazachstania africana (strain ATCC 22294 / BCRC 22015 / CBS 2517 / CECT 1963 / NBRC 1671 / NRRL Y-8276) TaxID=1071382 RepID=H2AVP3_KAZAF|nr:hypothetical protein KAFR_0E02910 [Kazachstania africana CBS 2517]CCF58443.1 hypothetical protein KAFR_0E02910 [Kazachstania africana CBS 2517]
MSMEGLDSYVPSLAADVKLQRLKRLPVKTIHRLTIAWLTRFNTDYSKLKLTKVERKLDELIALDKINRKDLAKLVLSRYFNRGLNMRQLADIEFETLLHLPNHHKWNSLTIYDSKTNKYIPHLNYQDVQRKLSEDFKRSQINSHISFFDHPKLPITCFRIKLFELNHTSRQSFWLIFIPGTPILFHSHYNELNDPFVKLLFNHLKGIILPNQIVYFKKNENEPIKSLDTIYLTSGVTRYGNAMANWISYSHGDKVDNSPLSNSSSHTSIGGMKLNQNDNKEKCLIRFNGMNCEQNHIPVEKVNFLLNVDDGISIKFKFQGNDVFKGIRSLCEDEVIDIDKIPGWLCGENSIKSGVITENGFQAIVEKDRLF